MPADEIGKAINRLDFNESARQTNATFDAWIDLVSSEQPYRDKQRMKVKSVKVRTFPRMMSDLKESLGKDEKKTDKLLGQWYEHFHPAAELPRGVIITDVKKTSAFPI